MLGSSCKDPISKSGHIHRDQGLGLGLPFGGRQFNPPQKAFWGSKSHECRVLSFSCQVEDGARWRGMGGTHLRLRSIVGAPLPARHTGVPQGVQMEGGTLTPRRGEAGGGWRESALGSPPRLALAREPLPTTRERGHLRGSNYYFYPPLHSGLSCLSSSV